VALTPRTGMGIRRRADERGETQVRSELEHGQTPPRFVHLASKWLSDSEQEARRRGEVFQSEKIELMRGDCTAAERQAIAAERGNQKIDLAAPPHPFARERLTFDALLQSRQDTFAGSLVVSDATVWSSTAGGVESLHQFWINVVERP